jgi:tRNA pseudouridine13 synthase
MYEIKRLPEDFYVEEMMTLPLGDGKYAYYKLTKKNMTTVDAISRISKVFHIRPKYINFSGTKDKAAVTVQYISVSMGPKRSIRTERLGLEYVGNGSERIHLGMHQGNSFRIVVRNIGEPPRPIARIRNLFDSQRFSRNNKDIGKAIVQKDFAKAVELCDEPCVKGFIAANPNNFVGALKTLPKKILLLYVHAYQSYLWNMMAEKSEALKLPLIGIATPESADVDKALEAEGLKRSDFVIRQMPELSMEGGERDVFVDINDLKAGELEPDELNPGMKKTTLQFSLPNGSYATMAVRQLFVP